ncbi:hypothetical protein [Coleofasciculus sp. H7-2]|uniref:hypothetical protein n=1 Tax=Coleofasciculus sp. H7-2 TaxID=3351545 RepID=UPI00366D3012
MLGFVPQPNLHQMREFNYVYLLNRTKNQNKLETIAKLRQFGLSDEQIAGALELPLEIVKQVGLEG